jgi:hypothetical protein
MNDTSTPVRIKKIKTYSYHTTIASVGVALIVGFGGGMFATSRAMGQTISVMDSAQPDGVDFVPVWKVWKIIKQKFLTSCGSVIESNSDNDRRTQPAKSMGHGKRTRCVT